VQNWYPGDEEGKGGIYNFVTKRGDCRGTELEDLLDPGRDRLRHHLEVSELHPARRQLASASSTRWPLTNNRQQADTGTKMIHLGKNTKLDHHLQGHLRRAQSSNTYRGLVRIAPAAPNARNFTQCDSLLIGDKCGAHTFPYIEVKNPSARSGARGDHVEDQRRPALLLPAARPHEEKPCP
jgi:Fe-S cluster assembly protein SufB